MNEKMNIKLWVKELECRQEAIRKERDKLDSVIEEMEMLKETCDRAWYCLQDARDALSELV